MKLLLTSAGVKNPSIHDALVSLLGKPIAEADALLIPTAGYANPGGIGRAWQFIAGQEQRCPMGELGWKSLGVLELTALPSLDESVWVPAVRETDVLLVNGGDALYLNHWMRESGLAALLPSLTDTVWVGLSAGSMVMTPRIGEEFVGWKAPGGDDRTLGLVDFAICPHLAIGDQWGNTMAEAEEWAAKIDVPAYAIDDETAIKVVDGVVEVVSEGHWRLLTPGDVPVEGLPVLELAAPGPMRDSGVSAILDGTKTTMTGLPALHEAAGEPLPAPGDRFCVVGSDGRPAAVIEMTHVGTEPISAITDEYAHAEGRGYRDAAHWRAEHEDFFRSEFVAGILGGVPDLDDDTLVVTQRFRLVGRPAGTSA
jgi:dipeptidase E